MQHSIEVRFARNSWRASSLRGSHPTLLPLSSATLLANPCSRSALASEPPSGQHLQLASSLRARCSTDPCCLPAHHQRGRFSYRADLGSWHHECINMHRIPCAHTAYLGSILPLRMKALKNSKSSGGKSSALSQVLGSSAQSNCGHEWKSLSNSNPHRSCSRTAPISQPHVSSNVNHSWFKQT